MEEMIQGWRVFMYLISCCSSTNMNQGSATDLLGRRYGCHTRITSCDNRNTASPTSRRIKRERDSQWRHLCEFSQPWGRHVSYQTRYSYSVVNATVVCVLRPGSIWQTAVYPSDLIITGEWPRNRSIAKHQVYMYILANRAACGFNQCRA